MKSIVTTHGEVHGESINSTVRTGTNGADLKPYVSIGNRFFAEPDAKALLKALGEAVEAAWPAPVEAKRCLDETTTPCRSPNWVAAKDRWCSACLSAGSPLPAVGR